MYLNINNLDRVIRLQREWGFVIQDNKYNDGFRQMLRSFVRSQFYFSTITCELTKTT